MAHCCVCKKIKDVVAELKAMVEKRDVLGDVDRGVHEEANMGKGKVGVWR
jgi:hypothetical protein